MTAPLQTEFTEIDTDGLAGRGGQMVIFASEDGSLDAAARKIDRLTRKTVSRFVAGKAFEKGESGSVHLLLAPAGLAADSLHIVKLDRNAAPDAARRAGARLGAALATGPLTVIAASHRNLAHFALGLVLRVYAFADYRTSDEETESPLETVTFQTKDPEALRTQYAPLAAQAEGVFFTRDLVSEPANVLTTSEFAARLAALDDLGLKVRVLEEDALSDLGMRALLAVGQGSDSPSKVVIMEWNGGGGEPPLALVGKGVVFDTGGISIKPAAGMEGMTMDMGGAGVVSGVMKTLALRKAKANVVGIVGIVENMPDGRAQRPGDVVRSMKGDTIEVINTDAEGRLVLADVLWYAQQEFEPAAIIDLATLTGAVIIALGHENAGVFGDDDKLAQAFLKAADQEGEGAWRLPLAPNYDKLLKSRIADVANVGGRSAGSITAAQFLKRFIADGTPWLHIDIAGVASVPSATDLAPKGATGWGVRALDRLVRARFETGA